MAPVLRSLLLMTLGVALLTANDAASKYLVQSYPVGQVIGLRQAATLLVLIPYVMCFSRWSALRVVDWPGQLGRGVLFIIGSVFIVWSLAELPLATAITMLFASPIFMVVLSAPLLGERIGRHRWIAVIGGFAGVLIILRPGAESFQWALLLPLAAAMINALRDVITRWLSRTETSIAILFWSNIILMAGGFATLPFGWQAVTWHAGLWFLAAGIFNGSAHFLIIEALRTGEASVLAPVRYTALLWAAAIGFLVWGELPELWLWAGAAVIVGSSLYMIRGERRR
ncbi:MAG: DMT family transporter [Burkholderiales bacterium]|nr:DMT family transporter [Burkholderiales bacterium]MDP2398166.1 DMT family transporter [Burkholderiales bacterium]